MNITQIEQWYAEYKDELGKIIPDYHRLQVEYFIWREFMGKHFGKPENLTILDIGVEHKRPYLTKFDYFTLNNYDPLTSMNQFVGKSFDSVDLIGDIHDLNVDDNYYDYVIATEVFEHLERPWVAINEVRRILKPNGVALLTSPFLWPWHGTEAYQDFWRITADGWRSLCKDFKSVRVYTQEFNPQSSDVLRELMNIEGMGDGQARVLASTGYAVRAVK